MKIVEVKSATESTYYRRGEENAKRVYVVRLDGREYKVIASSRRGAEMQAELAAERDLASED